MAKPGPSSFRRILLSRILLLSLPVLLIGEVAAFRKARHSLLATSRQHVNISAERKSERFLDTIATLQTKMLVSSQTMALKSGSPSQAQKFLDRLMLQLPDNIYCIQLVALSTNKAIASTCNNYRLSPAVDSKMWSQQENAILDPQSVYIQEAIAPNNKKQMQLLLSAPVYDRTGQLSYVLRMQSALRPEHDNDGHHLGSIADSTVIIAENGTILAHPDRKRIGRNISQEANAEAYKKIISNAIAGKQEVLDLSLAKNGAKFLAGYTAIPSPITQEQGQRWIILAVTRLDSALFGLQEIQLVLVVLTIGLLGASLLTTLHLARDLTAPLKQLRDYALKLQNYHEVERMPHDFQIKEFNQLAEALDLMVERLKSSAEEVEIAWEEAKAANNSKSNFLATTSHELRNPLNAIINCIRLVRDDCCDDRAEEMEFLERAEDAAIHLLGIINDLLDIAKIESGKLSLVLEVVDLRQVLKEAISLQSVHAEQKNLHLLASEAPEPILVQADRAKLKQVLINIIGNAVKFTEQGSITVKTRLEADGNSLRAIVAVQDTGVGVDPAHQHKLFRPFVMVDGTTTRKFGGTGLGLAISKTLMELMGGNIMLCSAGVNRGTTVAIALPVVNAAELKMMNFEEFDLGSKPISGGDAIGQPILDRAG
ncbi:sensor histidine kinase [Aliterella atlantica]|uniref:sensor histidine kinase n=1 Tax=Aliterella atlantica TaxID=1827278 RepID=UPI000697DAC3|nr:ATP-binding protein [Aliterella atlantica]